MKKNWILPTSEVLSLQAIHHGLREANEKACERAKERNTIVPIYELVGYAEPCKPFPLVRRV